MTETILIIDDEQDVLDFLSHILGYTYKIFTAPEAGKAQQLLDEEIIHLIISDVMMPGMNGFELCQLIKSNIAYSHIPIILLTSKNTHQAHIEGLQVGADAYIQKPFSVDLLLSQIQNLLKNRIKIKDHFASDPFAHIQVPVRSKKDELFLQQLDEYINAHMKEPNIDFDALAEHLFMSRATFYRKITALMSLSPKEFVDMTKLKKAAALMSENRLTLPEIIKLTGFSSEAGFSRSFEAQYKMSPEAYYASLQEGE
ncbi:DNA-binding response regulator [Niabella yanshanensis]|uniref:DNA-binding response regulator n=1 Tax=Niabella yanshanensis TaxID=577386 RepID=A0ABZ0W4U7_9BACT|nr:DNA-binding response regulator [Niabella yanshanensis]WQD38211.1 DNA-binding response regulator [Niabella yanshanensis]